MTVKDWLGEDNQIGIDIWEKKYRRNDEDFDSWLDRVSGGVEDVRRLIVEKKFLFGGRILSNRGVDDKEEKTTYSNCYVITPPDDSIESIYDTCKKLARTYSYGGGCGIDISKLSPAGARVHNQAKSTSGAVSFMDTFSQVTGQIGQHGRRGALMISLECTHPDLEAFIDCKTDLSKVTVANTSVRVSDAFMKAVEQDADWELSFTRPETGETISKTVKARALFDRICENNWNYAEPGVLFWDRIKSYNLLSNTPEFEYAGTNPCAEEPLPAGGSCLLGALNLAAFVDADGFNWNAFYSAVQVAVQALNLVLDEGLAKHPLQEQRDSVKDWRQIGLGIMGLADMLIALGITYGSSEAVELCDLIGKTMVNAALTESAYLADKDDPYPKYTDAVIQTDFYKAHLGAHTPILSGLRNSQILTIAPTGTISTMLGISGGIEPIFANSYTRMTKSVHGKDKAYKIYTPVVQAYMTEHGITDENDLPAYFVTSADIAVADRVRMQSIWQKHIDASISSTINLPNSATVEDVKEVYMDAWKAGLKGVTVYRAGCAREGILTTKDTEKKPEKGNTGLERHLTTGCGSLHVCAFFDGSGELRNTYLSKGSTGGCNNFMVGLSRMISLAARNGVSTHDIVDQLKSGGTCPSYAVRKATKCDTSPGSSCPVAIGNALIEMWEETNGKKPEECEQSGAKCPECGGALRNEGGCNTCPSCGWSKCL